MPFGAVAQDLRSPIKHALPTADPAISAFEQAFGTGWMEALCVSPGPGDVASESLAIIEGAAPDCLSTEPPQPVRPPAPDLLGYAAVAIGVRNMAQEKWEMARTSSLEGVRGPWVSLLQGMQTGPFTETRIAAVNRWVNRHVTFVADRGGDRWAGGPQTLSRGWGDCEDIALAKMALLESLGLSRDDMYLVLLRHRGGGDDHAVLAVRHAGYLLLLDNRSDTMSGSGDLQRYAPTISFSGPFVWTYGYATAGIDARSAAP